MRNYHTRSTLQQRAQWHNWGLYICKGLTSLVRIVAARTGTTRHPITRILLNDIETFSWAIREQYREDRERELASRTDDVETRVSPTRYKA